MTHNLYSLGSRVLVQPGLVAAGVAEGGGVCSYLATPQNRSWCLGLPADGWLRPGSSPLEQGPCPFSFNSKHS